MTQTNPEQWAVELWRKACHDYGGMSIEGGWGERNAATLIQAAFAEREARLVGALDRQCDNMAFVINHVNLHGFYDKFQAELEADRATLAALKDWTHG